MKVEEFVTKLQTALRQEEFEGVCKKAATGEMGFGQYPNDWGTKDGKG